MLHKTRGIVLQSIKYSESSNIIKIYTEEFGLKSYIVRGLRKSKSKNKSALFQHLSLLDLVVYNKEKQSIQNIKEVKPAFLFQNIPFDIKKGSIILFMNELINKSVREEEPNQALFGFLFDAITALDKMKSGIANLHLIFSLKFTAHLGFYPHGAEKSENVYFDMREGTFQHFRPSHDEFVSDVKMLNIKQLLNFSYENADQPSLNNLQRKELLEIILRYYQLHLPDFTALKSIDVLHSVFN